MCVSHPTQQPQEYDFVLLWKSELSRSSFSHNRKYWESILQFQTIWSFLTFSLTILNIVVQFSITLAPYSKLFSFTGCHMVPVVDKILHLFKNNDFINRVFFVWEARRVSLLFFFLEGLSLSRRSRFKKFQMKLCRVFENFYFLVVAIFLQKCNIF